MKFADVRECPVPAFQNLAEFGNLWEFIEARQPKNLLEIGSLYGGTLWHWAALPTLDRLVVIDVPSDRPEFATDVREARTHWAAWCAELDFHDIAADSHAPETVARVEEILAGELLDFAFIDGDHSESGVRRDLELYRHLIRPGGVVAFHDTIPNGGRHEPGVVKLVGELRWQHTSIEFFDPDGVGIAAFVL